MGLYSLLRPLLFRLDPESAHAWSLRLMRLSGGLPPLRGLVASAFRAPSCPVEAFGLRFPNPVGLAAGYDKDGLGWRGLAGLGFGHLELGTVTPRPQPGNPKPRVFRLREDDSLINRLGFPGRGAEHLARRLRDRPGGGPVIGVNLGKQRDTPIDRATDDYELLIDRFASLADYLAINVSSPNTPELRRLEQRDRLEPLLAALVRRRNAARAGVPLLVKLSPDMTDEELEQSVAAIAAAGIDGIVATNTTCDRTGLRSPAAREEGGLSGAALTERSTAVVRRIHELTRGALPIVACGGIGSPEDAAAKLEAGACLVQIYTGLIYQGPGLVGRIVRALASR